MLMEHETAKLKEQEEEYNRELKEWKSQLKPRKQVSAFTFYGRGQFHADQRICFKVPEQVKYFVHINIKLLISVLNFSSNSE